MGQAAHLPTSAVGLIGDQLELLGIPPRVSEEILTLVVLHARPDAVVSPETPAAVQSLADSARFFQKRSLERSDVLGRAIVCESAWNMLLDLFAAAEEEQRLSVSALTVMSGAPATTALRQIALLGRSGLIERVPDREDHRRSWVNLTTQGHAVMARLIESALIPLHTRKHAGTARLHAVSP